LSEEIRIIAKKVEFRTIDTDRIEYNPLNPRRVFREKDINELCNSIMQMGGIIVPLVVFEKDHGDYMLLDGQRRLMAARKLGMKRVPANVIPRKLSDGTNLVTMFSIHMQRVQWNPAARAIALGNLQRIWEKIPPKQLSEITGMSRTELRDAERILSCPEDIQERCVKEGDPQYLRPAYLIEMIKSFENIEKYVPDFFKEFDREKAIRTFVEKIDEGIIIRNTDFRKVSTIAKFLPRDSAARSVKRLLEEKGLTIEDAYEEVEDLISARKFSSFKRVCSRFKTAVSKFHLESQDKKTRAEAEKILGAILETLKAKLGLS
jgi:ParB family chromosome partitioning protein